MYMYIMEPFVERAEDFYRVSNRKLVVLLFLFDSSRPSAEVLLTDEEVAAAAGSLSANITDFPLITQSLLLLLV